MQWFLNLKMGAKVLVVLGVELVLLAGVALIAIASLLSVQASNQELYDIEFANAVDVAVMMAVQNNMRGGAFKLMLLDDPAALRTERNDIGVLSGEVDSIMARLQTRNSNNSEFMALLKPWNDDRLTLNRVREERQIPMLESGNVPGALDLALGEQAERLRRLREASNKLIETSQKRAEEAIIADEAKMTRIIISLFVVTFVAILITFGSISLMNRAMASPLNALSAMAARVAQRDLTVTVEDDGRRDEVGILRDTFHEMITNLRAITRDVNEGIGVLAASSSEIMASSSQVAAGAAETATALSETTSTVEEVKQTATMAAQKAKAVSESSQRANEFARSSNHAMQETAEGMRGVRSQMDAIAESITRLSEQGQSIGVIIASVDDIAEQSNLLAVNAAIEAARAGEHGMGFGVVAQEMRRLAEQSKEATKQVRQILNDIQRGVSQAGMATEQGTRSVETGIERSEDASKTIQTLLESVRESSQAAVQIAAASQQQLAGMDQVALAMENVRSAGEQNAAATRQVEDSARGLGDLGRRLKDLIGQYKI